MSKEMNLEDENGIKITFKHQAALPWFKPESSEQSWVLTSAEEQKTASRTVLGNWGVF